MTKTTNNIRNTAIGLKKPMVDFLRSHLDSYGDVTDQLRVMGYLGQAMVDMANAELAAIKLQDEMENKPDIIKVYQN